MNDIGIIWLTKGRFALVDVENFSFFNKRKWHFSFEGYAARNEPNTKGKSRQRTVMMHREINNTPDGFMTDHINGYGFDNRRRNLRTCTHSQNMFNQKKKTFKNRKTSSQHKGVYWHKKDKKWYTRIFAEGNRISLGFYDLEIDAARAYNEAALKYYGEFAYINKI